MTTYTDVFGGANIYPSEISYSAVALAANTQLYWPEETSAADSFATRIMDVSASGSSLWLTMPDARGASPGETVLFNNIGTNSFEVRDRNGTTILTVASGTAWQLYLTDNSTESGSWRAFQYGAGVSSANAAALAGTGLVAVGALLSQSIPIVDFNTNYTSGNSDRARMLVWSGAGGTLTLPACATVGNNWFIGFRNAGSGAVTVDPSGTETIDGSATISMQPGESAFIVTDGANYFTLGRGQSATFAFDYTTIDVSGTGNYTLAGSELNRIAYAFTGTLTGNRTIIVPATVQQYWVNNATTGAYTFTIKTAAGTGQTVSTGQRGIYYCDGTNVVDADSATLSTPIGIADGGTGAATASAARTNLGATSLGDALFTAANTAAAWSALGAAPSGTVDGGVF